MVVVVGGEPVEEGDPKKIKMLDRGKNGAMPEIHGITPESLDPFFIGSPFSFQIPFGNRGSPIFLESKFHGFPFPGSPEDTET